MNNGGGNRGACLCKFPGALISFMLNGQNSGAACKTICLRLYFLCQLFYFLHSLPHILSSLSPFFFFVFLFSSTAAHFLLTLIKVCTGPFRVDQYWSPHLLSKPFLLNSRSVLAQQDDFISLFFFHFSLGKTQRLLLLFFMSLVCIFIVSLLALLCSSCSPPKRLFTSISSFLLLFALQLLPCFTAELSVHEPHAVRG